MPHQSRPLPPDVESACVALARAVRADPERYDDCAPLARALGAACRTARLSGRRAYQVIVGAIDYVPSGPVMGRIVPTTPHERLALIAIDAFYAVDHRAGDG